MTIRSKQLAPAVVAAFIIGIGGTMAFNLWQTEGSKIPARYSKGEFAGEYDPADIRGSYTFADITAAFGVPADDLGRAFGLAGIDDLEGFQVKELEELYGVMENGEIGTDSVRYFVAIYSDLPYVPKEDTVLPVQAVSVLKERVSAVTLEAVRSRTVNISGLKAVSPAADHDGPSTEDRFVRGRTTFAEIRGWGLTDEEIESAIGMEPGPPGTTVRDYLSAKGVEFSTAKDSLQKIIDGKTP